MFRMKKQKAFTMVELMMLLLVASLIIAACLPVITRKHFKLPSTVIHGTYLCYYKEGKLHETKWVGRAVQKKILDRDTNNCVFEPPAKAPYFQVSAIGGGGGGGDSGYTGGDPKSGVHDVSKFSPFEIKASALTERNISGSSFNLHAGELLVYARGLDSGAGGDVGYTDVSYGSDTCTDQKYKEGEPNCTERYNNPGKECYLETVESTDTGTTGSGNFFTRMAAKITNFFKTTLAFKPGVLTGAADSATTPCAAYHSETNMTGCSEWNYEYIEPYTIYEPCNCKDVQGTKTENKCDTCTKGGDCVPGYKNVCPHGSSSSDSKSGHSGGCHSEYDSCASTSPTTTYSCNCHDVTTVTHNWKCEKCPAGTGGGYSVPTDCKTPIYTTTTVYDTGSATSCVVGENQKLVCKDVDKEDCKTWEKTYDKDYCAKGLYNVTYTDSTAYGGAAGKGGACYSNTIPGAIGLTQDYSQSTIIGVKAPSDGDSDFTKNSAQFYCTPGATAGDGTASCADGSLRNNCGPGTNTTYSLSAIFGSTTSPTGGTARLPLATAVAYSSPKGGTGASRTCESGLLKTGYTKTSADAAEVDYGTTVSMDVPHDGVDGSNGICGPQSNKCEDNPEYCGTAHNGYKLIHNYPSSSTATNLKDPTGETMSADKIEEGGFYRYKDSYDSNYLTSGATGSPGEFRTVIVRSLKDMDMTIRIGRGGSGAPLGSGNAGSDGSPTIFGTDSEHYIVKSNGGAGGAGSVMGDRDYGMEKYNHSKYLKEDACWNRSKYFATSEDGSYTDTSAAAQAAREKWQETGSTVDDYCSAYVNASDYKYHKSNVGEISNSDYPTPIGIVSTVMNFVFNANDTSDAVKRFVKFGRGGRGGGVEHNCWAGRWEVWFEGWLLKDTSVYGSKADAEAVGDSAAVSEHRYVTNACRNDWESVPGSTGVDGALLIKW